MVDLGSIKTGLFSAAGGFARSAFYVVIAVVFIFVSLYIGLLTKRKRRFDFIVLEYIDCGNNKVDIYPFRGGWFKKRHMFNHLIELGGEREMLTSDWRKIFNVSSEDYHFYNGRKCLLVQRDMDDPEVLVPIKNVNLDEKSKAMLNMIAPADYRDAGVQILERKQAETQTWWDKHGAQIMSALILIFFIISLIIITHWISTETSETRKMLLEIAKTVTQKPSVAAP